MIDTSHPRIRPWTTLSGTRILRRHPGVRRPNQLTRGERAADVIRNGMGSWAFVAAALGFLAVWMVVNGRGGFDPYPFILLNLVLSCLAALQGAILLIAGKRSDQISSELAVNDFDTDQAALQQLAELRQSVDDLQALLRRSLYDEPDVDEHRN